MKRELFGFDGNLIERDFGFDFQLYDINSNATLEELIQPEKLLDLKNDAICTKVPICNDLHFP